MNNDIYTEFTWTDQIEGFEDLLPNMTVGRKKKLFNLFYYKKNKPRPLLTVHWKVKQGEGFYKRFWSALKHLIMLIEYHNFSKEEAHNLMDVWWTINKFTDEFKTTCKKHKNYKPIVQQALQDGEKLRETQEKIKESLKVSKLQTKTWWKIAEYLSTVPYSMQPIDIAIQVGIKHEVVNKELQRIIKDPKKAQYFTITKESYGKYRGVRK